MNPVQIKMGDHVLLLLGDPEVPRHYQTMEAGLQARFPGVEFTFVCGVTGALVLTPGDAHD
jgi:hypothetical protein